MLHFPTKSTLFIFFFMFNFDWIKKGYIFHKLHSWDDFFAKGIKFQFQSCQTGRVFPNNTKKF